jgi:hypothetical protein
MMLPAACPPCVLPVLFSADVALLVLLCSAGGVALVVALDGPDVSILLASFGVLLMV